MRKSDQEKMILMLDLYELISQTSNLPLYLVTFRGGESTPLLTPTLPCGVPASGLPGTKAQLATLCTPGNDGHVRLGLQSTLLWLSLPSHVPS